MNTATLLKAASAHGGPIVLSAGVAMLAAALVDTGRAEPPTAIGPTAAPTVTVTAAATPPVGRPTTDASAAVSGSLVAADARPGPAAPDQPVTADSGPSPRPQSPVPGGSSTASPAPGTGSPSAGCTRADVSLCLRLGIASGRVITKGR